jgi:hypothetical protein
MHTQTRLVLISALALASWLCGGTQARADRASRMVASWYERYLDRYPDPDGLRDWADKLRRGWDPLEVEAGILSSDEYWQRAGSNPAGWVDRLFRDATGRPASVRDFRFWTDRARRADRKRVALEFLRQLNGDRPWY